MKLGLELGESHVPAILMFTPVRVVLLGRLDGVVSLPQAFPGPLGTGRRRVRNRKGGPRWNSTLRGRASRMMLTIIGVLTVIWLEGTVSREGKWEGPGSGIGPHAKSWIVSARVGFTKQSELTHLLRMKGCEARRDGPQAGWRTLPQYRNRSPGHHG